MQAWFWQFTPIPQVIFFSFWEVQCVQNFPCALSSDATLSLTIVGWTPKRQAIGQKPKSLSWDDWHLRKGLPKATFFVYQSGLERDRHLATPLTPQINPPIHGVVVKETEYDTRLPGVESCFHHLSAVWPWAGYLTFLGLSFLACDMGIMIVPI